MFHCKITHIYLLSIAYEIENVLYSKFEIACKHFGVLVLVTFSFCHVSLIYIHIIKNP